LWIIKRWTYPGGGTKEVIQLDLAEGGIGLKVADSIAEVHFCLEIVFLSRDRPRLMGLITLLVALYESN